MADVPTSYVHMKSPGNSCQRCGIDISHRASTTKYCTDCKQVIANEKQRNERNHYKQLVQRDTVMAPVPSPFNAGVLKCGACTVVVLPGENFCVNCGQRLKETKEEINV